MHMLDSLKDLKKCVIALASTYKFDVKIIKSSTRIKELSNWKETGSNVQANVIISLAARDRKSHASLLIAEEPKIYTMLVTKGTTEKEALKKLLKELNGRTLYLRDQTPMDDMCRVESMNFIEYCSIPTFSSLQELMMKAVCAQG